MKKILLTGGTGFIGLALCSKLLGRNYSLSILSRKILKSENPQLQYVSNLDEKEFDYDIIINLCGEPISQRWSKKKKEEIYQSRIGTTQKITQKILSSKNPPSLFISGSAIGYYGTSPTQIFQEKTPPTTQNLFSKKLCLDWENAAKKASDKTRLVILRTGVVVGAGGGIIQKMLPPFKLGLGGKIGAGNQQLSWIHLQDAVGAILHIIDHEEIRGAINLCAPQSCTNSEFSNELARSLGRPCFFTIPAFAMKLIYAEMANELLLNGQKVYPRALIESGYNFKFTNIKEALMEAAAR